MPIRNPAFSDMFCVATQGRRWQRWTAVAVLALASLLGLAWALARGDYELLWPIAALAAPAGYLAGSRSIGWVVWLVAALVAAIPSEPIDLAGRAGWRLPASAFALYLALLATPAIWAGVLCHKGVRPTRIGLGRRARTAALTTRAVGSVLRPVLLLPLATIAIGLVALLVAVVSLRLSRGAEALAWLGYPVAAVVWACLAIRRLVRPSNGPAASAWAPTLAAWASLAGFAATIWLIQIGLRGS